jgi:phosphate/sulfate permease
MALTVTVSWIVSPVMGGIDGHIHTSPIRVSFSMDHKLKKVKGYFRYTVNIVDILRILCGE